MLQINPSWFQIDPWLIVTGIICIIAFIAATVIWGIRAHQLSQTQIGVGYIDDCLILALNYVTDYAYSGSVSVNHTVMMQFALRTLGGNTGPGASALNTGMPAALSGIR